MKRLTMLLVTICTVFVLQSFIDYKDSKKQLTEMENAYKEMCYHSKNSLDKVVFNFDKNNTRRFY